MTTEDTNPIKPPPIELGKEIVAESKKRFEATTLDKVPVVPFVWNREDCYDGIRFTRHH